MTGGSGGGRPLAWLTGLMNPDGAPGLRRILGILLALSRMHWRRLAPALAAAAALSGLALVPPALLAQLIDRVFPSRAAATVVGFGLALVVIAALDAGLSFVRRMLAARVGLELRRDILRPAFAAILRLPADDPRSQDQGVLGRTFEEVERLAQGASESVLELVLGLGTVAVLATALIVVDAQVGLAVLAVVVALAALHAGLARSLRRREADWFEARSRYWSHLVESIAYVGTVRVNSAHGFAERRFSERLDGDTAAHLNVIRLSSGLHAAGQLAGGLITAAIALLGGLRVIDDAMSVGHFVLFLTVGGSLSAPVLGLVKTLDDFQAMTVSVARLSDLAAARHEDIPADGAPVAAAPGRLCIDGLTFAYPGGRPVLERFSLTLEPGERVALTGPSGVGKSTLASLMFGVRGVAQGSITLDGVPLPQIPLAELRRRIVVVPHDIDVFTGTVAENIALGAPEAGRAAVEDAARVACVDDDIRALPDGYDTLLGQGGVDLSAGQRQRLGIARAVLLGAGILILDESTASLDLDTERRVLDNLLGRMADATVLAITHRDSVARRMQRSLDIRHGA